MEILHEPWYEVRNPDTVHTPSLLVLKERIAFNIDLMVKIAGDVDRLIPHVKTHKMLEVTQMQLAVGITKFKCATLAEAEMLAQAGAKWVLIAYQLVGPNIDRLFSLQQKYSDVHFASLVDSLVQATTLNSRCIERPGAVFIDVNNGMDRSGFRVQQNLMELYGEIAQLENLTLEGLHVYDGHIREADFAERKHHSDTDFAPIQKLRNQLRQAGYPPLMIVAGGTPTFPVHAQRAGVYLSPGTCLLWDWGYGDRFRDLPFQYAAVLATRVISKPAESLVTVDLGHKAVAAENSVDRRFVFLNLKGYDVLSQSEEHGVIRVADWNKVQVGDLLYALPYHICPTVALHEFVTVVENRTVLDRWTILARRRMISI